MSDSHTQDRERTTRVVSSAASVSEPTRVPVLAPGDTVGRYTIRDQLGAGGMGVVYRAHDPSLDRDVALKVLREDRHPGSDGSRDVVRLVREARALAQVSHPHVVSIFDVGTLDDSVFIAMELVEGLTLRSWMRQGPHPVEEVIEIFSQAGQGLIAAHHVGLVHRDFKPGNVLMSRRPDGGWTCKVVDFGLARPALASEMSGGTGPSISMSADHSGEPLTELGTVVGTPAYMAPEQHQGDAVGPAADQYSFCVSLYETLCGSKPFVAENYENLVKAKTSKRVATEARKTSLVPWVERVLSRGLEPDPEARWPSMDALLDALSPRRFGARWTVAGLAATGVALSAWWWGTAREELDCEGARDRLAGIWDPATKQSVRDALQAAGGPNANHTWTRLEERIDTHTEQWVALHRETCQQVAHRSTVSPALDWRSACLETRRSELASLVELLRSADADIARRAMDATASLRPTSRCTDDEAIGAVMEAPADEATEAIVAQLRGQLGEARALGAMGRYEQADGVAQDVLRQARRLGYRPLLVEALEMAGRLRNSNGDQAASEALLTEGYWMAREVGHDTVAASIAIELVLLFGEGQARYDEALEWGKHATSDIERAGDPWVLREQLLINLGIVYFSSGDYEKSYQVLQRVRERHESSEVLINLGNVVGYRGDVGLAREYFQRAADLTEAEYGPEHPALATATMNVGSMAMRMGDFPAARSHYERAISIYENTVGTNNPDLGNALGNMGILLSVQGEYAEARPFYERAIAIWEASLGPDHPAVGQTYGNLARMLLDSGDPEEAIPLLVHALSIEEKVFGTDAPATLMTRANLARALWGTKQLEAARPHAERAVELSKLPDVPPSDRGTAEETLAFVLWDQGEREAALRHGRAAAEAFGEAPDNYGGSEARARAWLAQRDESAAGTP